MRRENGFTLLEMVLAMLIIGILGTTAATAIGYGTRAAIETQTRVDTLSDLRMATERMAREIRLMRRDPAAPANYDVLSRTGTSLSFRRLDSNGSSPRTVTIDGSTAPVVTLAYDSPAVTPAPVLVARVADFDLRYLDALGAETLRNDDLAFVEISLSILDDFGNVFAQRSRVALRNRQ
jgi:MSHA biogenesis protein MshO